MPKWDFKCPRCGHIIERAFRSFEEMKAAKLHWCPMACNAPMERQPAAPSFVVEGFSAKNGYSGGNK